MRTGMRTMGDPNELDRQLEQISENAAVVRSQTGGETEMRDRTKWTPTPEEFAAYLAKEIEMAKVSLSKGVRAVDTLFTSNTLTRAQEENAKEEVK
jgi:hypothetical protein